MCCLSHETERRCRENLSLWKAGEAKASGEQKGCCSSPGKGPTPALSNSMQQWSGSQEFIPGDVKIPRPKKLSFGTLDICVMPADLLPVFLVQEYLFQKTDWEGVSECLCRSTKCNELKGLIFRLETILSKFCVQFSCQFPLPCHSSHQWWVEVREWVQLCKKNHKISDCYISIAGTGLSISLIFL